MDIVLQQIVNAISLGGIYALLALGLLAVGDGFNQPGVTPQAGG